MDLHVEDDKLATRLTGARLHLRPFTQLDAAAVTALLDNIAVSRWLTKAPHPFHHADGQALVAGAARLSGRVWAITADTAVIGLIGIQREFGYWLGQPYWGQGFMTEAARLVLAAWFSHTDQPVISGHMSGNAASLGLLSRLGFRDAGPATFHAQARQTVVAGRRMILTRLDWERHHAG